VLYGIIALIVMQSGVGWVERLMPPVVTGAVVAVIGLNLAPVAVKSVSADPFDTWIGLVTVLLIGLIAVAAPGLWRRLPIIFGAIGGYLLYLLLANGFKLGKPIDFTALAAAPWYTECRTECSTSFTVCQPNVIKLSYIWRSLSICDGGRPR